MLIRIIRAHFDPEIRDQLWILDRVYQKNPNKIKEYLGECIRQIHTHLRRKFVPYSRALGAVRVWESFFIDFRNFRSEVALSHLIGQLGQSQGT